MQLRSSTWWIVFLSLVVAGGALTAWLWLTDQTTAAQWVGVGFDIFMAGWLAKGLHQWRDHPIVRRIAVVGVGLVTMAVFVNLFYLFQMRTWMIATLGIGVMSIGFYIALQLARFLLSGGWPLLGVARTLLDEAVRMKVALVLLVLLFFLLPTLPLIFDPAERLAYQIQSFLTYSMILVTTLLSLLTIAVAVTTITRELEDRQIFMTMSKPVSRAQYLLGKWLGLTVLNALLIGVCGVGIYTFTMLMAEQPAMNEVDRREVQEQVLVARRAISPQTVETGLLQKEYEQRLAALRKQDPNFYGQPNDPIESIKPEARRAIQQQVLTGWYALRPRATQAYVFQGLSPAKQLAKTVQLRIQPKASGPVPDDELFLALRINDRDDAVIARKMLDDKYHTIEINTAAIDERGEIKIEIRNMLSPSRTEQPTITFNTADGLQMLYRVSGFESNVARSMVLLWLRLSFLSMVALAAGTCLGFPVAALLSILICIAASGSTYLGESIHEYAAFPKAGVPMWDRLMWVPSRFFQYLGEGEIWKSIKLIIALVGSGFMKLIPSFNEFSGTKPLASGLYVSPHLIGRAALWVGLVWTGVVSLVAWLIFRSRELARVQV